MDGLRILTISGWTQPADALLPIVPHADHLDYAGLEGFDAVSVAATSGHYDVIIGWSLGGVISRQLLKRGALSAKVLVLLSSPFRFVVDHRVSEAMPADVFEQFYANYRDDTQRTVNRFHGLVAKGDRDARRILDALSHHPLVLQTEHWLPWMDVLRDYNGFDEDYGLLPPTLIVHGREDAIVPYRQSEFLHQHLPQSEHEGWEGCGHAPHLHDASRLQARIQRFVEQVMG